MFFHCLVLDELSRELCTINTLFGLYCFNRLPQGAKVLPDLAQAVIIEIVHDINVDAYMDNCMLFTDKTIEVCMGCPRNKFSRLLDDTNSRQTNEEESRC